MDADARQRQIFTALNRLWQARSARAPFVIVFEDLHWLDPGSEAFLESLVDSVPGTRLLVVTTFRPEYHPPWGERSHYRHHPLLPLREAACDELMADLLGSHPSLDRVAELVRERTGGNPFFIEEVVQELVEEGYLTGGRGAYELSGTIDAVRIPATVQAVLAARIDRLPPPEKALLQTASVVGRQFSRRVITTVAGLSDDEVDADLRTLIDAELIYRTAAGPDDEYTFKHALTEEVAYGSQLARQRGRTHAAVARVLTELDVDKLDERASLIAHHFEASGELLSAAHWNARAAAWAGSTHQVEAARLWRSVRRLTDGLDQSAEVAELGFKARLALLGYYWRLGAATEDGAIPYEEQAAADYTHALAYAEAARQPGLVIGVRTLYTLVLVFAGAVEEGYDQIPPTIRIADDTGDLSLRVLARVPALYTLYLLGRVREGVACAEEQVVLTEEIRRSESDAVFGASAYSDCHQLRVYMRALFSQLDEELIALEREIASCVEEDEWEVEVFARRAWAVTADLAGIHPDRALAHASAARKGADERGGPLVQVIAREGVAVSHAQRGEWQEAIATADVALEVCMSRRVPVPSTALLLATRARAHIGQGDFPAARSDAIQAIAAAGRCGTRYYEALARLELARAMLGEPLSGGTDQAKAEVDQAEAIVEALGLRALVPQIHLTRAELAEAEGDPDAARLALETARRLFLAVGAYGRAEQTEWAQRDPNMSTMLRTDPSG
jgi:adenylate cyclase